MFEIKKIIGLLLMFLLLFGLFILVMVFLVIIYKCKVFYLGFVSILILMLISMLFIG